jgi:hypothetical protein
LLLALPEGRLHVVEFGHRFALLVSESLDGRLDLGPLDRGATRPADHRLVADQLVGDVTVPRFLGAEEFVAAVLESLFVVLHQALELGDFAVERLAAPPQSVKFVLEFVRVRDRFVAQVLEFGLELPAFPLQGADALVLVLDAPTNLLEVRPGLL